MEIRIGQHAEPLWLGLDISVWLNAASIIIGAVVALLVAGYLSPKLAAKSAKRDQQERLLRVLISTRQTVANPDYQAVINLIPIDFKGVRDILSAREAYLQCVRIPLPEGDELIHARIAEQFSLQGVLIHTIASHLGYAISESDLDASSYYLSQGFVDRQDIEVLAQRAWPRIADALERQNVLTEIAVGVRQGSAEN
jgi:hypothetical protein